MTQLGFLAILLALSLFAAAAGTATFPGLQQAAAHMSPALRNVIFLLSFVGFGSKAGLVPLHAWLARAHPEAPTPASALLSAAMVNLGVYGMLRVDVTLLGPGPRWWGLTLLIVGAGTAVYAALHAMTATDLKRMLAFSTSENMGLVTLGIGAAIMLHAAHRPVGQIAMAAAMLLVVAHAAFKTLAFLCAGAVLGGTGLRDLDRLGGLASRMPATAALFGVAALGASGLPLGAGFASEWLLLQGLIHTVPTRDVLLALTMPLAVAAVALTAGLSVAAMVKAVGVGFLARPRSEAAAEATEASPTMLFGAALAAVACVALALAPALLSPGLSRVLGALPATATATPPHLGMVLRLPALTGSVSPMWLAAAVAVALAVVAALGRLRAKRRPVARTAPLWGCGGPPLTPRMQYTASAYAEPVQRVFDDVLRPDIDVQVSHPSESRYLIEKVSYRARIADRIEQRLYRPVTAAVEAAAGWIRRVHTGSVHTYLGYGAAGLLLMLVLSR
jgi:formate hydrogenlyase subunit 3/multisubunit Na+/H+ antiporter MnhD subunit